MIKMKTIRNLFISVTVVIAAICGFCISGNKLSASAVDISLGVEVRLIDQAAANYYNNYNSSSSGSNCLLPVDSNNPIQAGDYIVTVTVDNNCGFAATGMRVIYNTSLCQCVMSNNAAVYFKEDVLRSSGITTVVICNAASGIIGLGTMGNDPATSNGRYISYFLRPLQSTGLTLSQEQQLIVGNELEGAWLDEHSNPVSCIPASGYTLYHYDSVYGDIDNNGTVNAADAQWLATIYVNNNMYIDMTNYTIVYNSNPEITGAHLIAVGDVNEDGVINMADAQAILNYYSTYVVGGVSGYTGIIGTDCWTAYYISFT